MHICSFGIVTKKKILLFIFMEGKKKLNLHLCFVELVLCNLGVQLGGSPNEALKLLLGFSQLHHQMCFLLLSVSPAVGNLLTQQHALFNLEP